jgi:protein-tyrosine phosphatase
VIDLHCHVVFGIDDGPATLADSISLMRASAANGTNTIVATPHVSVRYPNNAATIGALVAEVNEGATAEGIPLKVLTGAEIAMTRAAELEREELDALALGTGRWLLIECPFAPVATGLEALVMKLQGDGYRILLAHPERCPAFHREPEILTSLARGGVLSSITAGSLVGRFGRQVRDFAFELFQDRLAHNVASDAHDAVKRPPGALAEIEESGLAALADWLTEEVPAAILTDSEIPPRPGIAVPFASPRRRRRWTLGR